MYEWLNRQPDNWFSYKEVSIEKVYEKENE